MRAIDGGAVVDVAGLIQAYEGLSSAGKVLVSPASSVESLEMVAFSLVVDEVVGRSGLLLEAPICISFSLAIVSEVLGVTLEHTSWVKGQPAGNDDSIGRFRPGPRRSYQVLYRAVRTPNARRVARLPNSRSFKTPS